MFQQNTVSVFLIKHVLTEKFLPSGFVQSDLVCRRDFVVWTDAPLPNSGGSSPDTRSGAH